MNKEEEQLQSDICRYVDIKYPNVLYQTDLSGVRLTIGQARKLKQLRKGRAWPDIFFPEPIFGPLFLSSLFLSYNGLYIELKAGREQVYRKDGKLRKKNHLIEQNAMLEELRARGFNAEFGLGWEHTISIIDEYMKYIPGNIQSLLSMSI